MVVRGLCRSNERCAFAGCVSSLGRTFFICTLTRGGRSVARPYTEQQVLKKLDIPDFRHLTKEKVIAFATMVPKMNPEVAKKALEQFPNFAST